MLSKVSDVLPKFDGLGNLEKLLPDFRAAIRHNAVQRILREKIELALASHPQRDFRPEGFLIHDDSALSMVAWTLDLEFYNRYLQVLKTATEDSIYMNLGRYPISVQILSRGYDANAQRILQNEQTWIIQPRDCFFLAKGMALRFFSVEGLIVRAADKRQLGVVEYYDPTSLKMIARSANDNMQTFLMSVLKVIQVFPDAANEDFLRRTFDAPNPLIKQKVLELAKQEYPRLYHQLLFLAGNNVKSLRRYAMKEIGGASSKEVRTYEKL